MCRRRGGVFDLDWVLIGIVRKKSILSSSTLPLSVYAVRPDFLGSSFSTLTARRQSPYLPRERGSPHSCRPSRRRCYRAPLPLPPPPWVVNGRVIRFDVSSYESTLTLPC